MPSNLIDAYTYPGPERQGSAHRPQGSRALWSAHLASCRVLATIVRGPTDATPNVTATAPVAIMATPSRTSHPIIDGAGTRRARPRMIDVTSAIAVASSTK